MNNLLYEQLKIFENNPNNIRTKERDMIKPKKLQAGDKIAAITLSAGAAGAFLDRYLVGKKQIEEKFGLKVIEAEHALKDPHWIHKNPKARANDLMAAFSDPAIKAIFSNIGGDDSIRMLPYVDIDIIKKNPKIFMGFSDTTVSHFMCYKADLVSFYGSSIMIGFAENGGMFEYFINSINKTLFSTEAIGKVPQNIHGWTTEYLPWSNPNNQNIHRNLNSCTGWRFIQGSGVVTGKLLGGCMDVLEVIKGTEIWPTKENWKDTIVFFETSESRPSLDLIKLWLRNYGAQGILHEISGIIIGRPYGITSNEEMNNYERAFIDVIKDEFELENLPIVTQMDFGHTDPTFILPYGVKAEINCDQKTFSILESAVIE